MFRFLLLLLFLSVAAVPRAHTQQDLGATLNTQVAACRQACTIDVPPGVHTFATKIQLPPTPFVTLDCHNATLLFTGAGDAIDVAPQNSDSPTGSIQNCILANAEGNTRAINGIHQHSRIWMTYQNLTITGFTNPTSAGLLLDNDRQSWLGYSERTHMLNISFANNTKGLRLLGSNGGTVSFGRIVFEGECDVYPGQFCLSFEGTAAGQADVYAGTWSLHSNSKGPTSRVLSLTNAQFRASLVNIEGEGQGYLYWSDASSGINLQGLVANTGGLATYNAGASDQVLLPMLTAGFVLQATPFANKQLQANNPKILWDGTNFRMGFPQEYIYGNGSFQLFARHTDANPEVDAITEPAAPQINIFYCTFRGCGFGSGFGPGATTGGTRQPLVPIDSAGPILADTSLPLTNADLDGLTRCGTYTLTNPTHAPTGAPSSGILSVLCGPTPRLTVQLLYSLAGASQSWTRNQLEGHWSPWLQSSGGLTTTLPTTNPHGACSLTVTNGLITAKAGPGC